jgi:hypothetical protein
LALPYPVLVAFGAVIGLFIVEGSFVVLESGSMTMMVCFLLHPEALRDKADRAALYARRSVRRRQCFASQRTGLCCAECVSYPYDNNSNDELVIVEAAYRAIQSTME